MTDTEETILIGGAILIVGYLLYKGAVQPVQQTDASVNGAIDALAAIPKAAAAGIGAIGAGLGTASADIGAAIQNDLNSLATWMVTPATNSTTNQ